MKMRLLALLLLGLNTPIFAQEVALQTKKAQASGLSQILDGSPLISAFFFSVLILILVALFIVSKIFINNKYQSS